MVLFNVKKDVVIQILGEHFACCGAIADLKFSINQVNNVFKFTLPYRVVHKLELPELLASRPDFVVRFKQLILLFGEVRDADN